MDTLDYICQKYNVDRKAPRVDLPHSRWNEYPRLLRELGFQRGAEVGVYRGQYSERLMRRVPGLHLTAIDAWTPYQGYKDFEDNDIAAAYEQAQERARVYGFHILRAWSSEAAGSFADGSLDFVYLDGNHDFEHIAQDLVLWARKVRPGGIVSGHDFFRNRHKGFAVREVVTAWCEAHAIAPLFVWAGDKCPSWMYVHA